MDFWEHVDLICEYRGIPRKELAYKAQFSVNCISTGIARNSMPFADVACRIAKVLGVSVEYLVTGETAAAEHTDGQLLQKIIADKKDLLYKYASVLEELDSIPRPQRKPLLAYIHELAGDCKADNPKNP